MGQYANPNGGIYLVESPEDVDTLEVKDADNLHYMSQTTLSVDDTADVIDALRQRFPNINGPRKDDICYATQNRQDAVRQLSAECDLLLVVGSPNSSNSNRLRELAERECTESYLIDNETDIDPNWLNDKTAIGITAGASAPEVLVKSVVEKLCAMGAEPPVELDGRPETITFSMPKALRIVQN